MARDPYETLGLSRDADDTAIKKAYRKLAKKYHPDVNKSAKAKETFAEVQRAYEVLSDAQKRSSYDRFGDAGHHEGAAEGAGGGRTYTGPDGFNFRAGFEGDGANLNDVFEQFFGGGGGRARARRGAQQGFTWETGRGPRSGAEPTRGADLLHELTIPFTQGAKGGSVSLRIASTDGGGAPKTLEVKTPPGIADGAKLRLRGKGHPSPGGGEAGDLILTVRVAPHPYFRREGLNLELDVPLAIDEALFGAEVSIPTLDGQAKLKVPPGTGSGKRLRLKGAGIAGANGERGDLFAHVLVDAPKEISADIRAALEQVRGKLPNPRLGLGW